MMLWRWRSWATSSGVFAGWWKSNSSIVLLLELGECWREAKRLVGAFGVVEAV